MRFRFNAESMIRGIVVCLRVQSPCCVNSRPGKLPELAVAAVFVSRKGDFGPGNLLV